MFKVFIETSSFVLFVRRSLRCYCNFDRRLDEVYKNSLMHRVVKKLCDRIKVYFKYSFLDRITEIKEQDNAVILCNSKFVIWVLDIYKNWKYRIIDYLRTSIFASLTDELKKSLFFLSVKIGSTILVTAILVNIFLFLLFDKEIGLLGWILRGSLLFIGLGGVICNANWQDLKRTCLILRYLERKV